MLPTDTSSPPQAEKPPSPSSPSQKRGLSNEDSPAKKKRQEEPSPNGEDFFTTYIDKRKAIIPKISQFLLIWNVSEKTRVRPDQVTTFICLHKRKPVSVDHAYQVNDWWKTIPGNPDQSWRGCVARFSSEKAAECMLKKVQVSFRDLRAMPVQEVIDELGSDEALCPRLEASVRKVTVSSKNLIRKESDADKLKNMMQAFGTIEEINFPFNRPCDSSGYRVVCEVTFQYWTQAVATVLVYHMSFKDWDLKRLVLKLDYTKETASLVTSARQTIMSKYACDRFPFVKVPEKPGLREYLRSLREN